MVGTSLCDSYNHLSQHEANTGEREPTKRSETRIHVAPAGHKLLPCTRHSGARPSRRLQPHVATRSKDGPMWTHKAFRNAYPHCACRSSVQSACPTAFMGPPSAPMHVPTNNRTAHTTKQAHELPLTLCTRIQCALCLLTLLIIPRGALDELWRQIAKEPGASSNATSTARGQRALPYPHDTASARLHP